MGDERYTAEEQRMLQSADEELEALGLARSATAILEMILQVAAVHLAPEPAPASWYVRSGLLNIAVIAMRTARACMLVISAGYEPEAHGLKRRLSEAHARAQAMSADPSGQHAREWLEGKDPSTPRKIAGKYGSLDLFDLYSQSAHVDARGVAAWIAIPLPEVNQHHKGLIAVPNRRPDFANGMLVEVAVEVRDIASVLARSQGPRIKNIALLDRQIDAAAKRWHSPADDADSIDLND